MADPLPIVRTVKDLRAATLPWRRAEATVGVVPTMGALHDGHLALVRTARAECDRVVATLFVNPAQFGPDEDLSRYPRREAEDAKILAREGVDVLWAPPVEEMYPPGFATVVHVSGITDRLEGEHRPGHFDGVTTVVAKLFTQTQADRAYFGEKDYQQLQAVRRMAVDLDLPVEIVGVPTVREQGGLALSSRNEYLSAEQREIALALNRILFALADRVAGGADPVAEAEAGREALLAAGFDAVDYVAVVDAETLVPFEPAAGHPGRALAAARLGGTRLIDNVPVAPRG